MSDLPNCPECGSEYAYENGPVLACPDCGHEWSPSEAAANSDDAPGADDAVLDSNGNALADGDTITLIKDLKVKGAQGDLKAGTKVKNIRLCEGDHNIDCKIPGFGAMKLKSEFVRKG